MVLTVFVAGCHDTEDPLVVGRENGPLLRGAVTTREGHVQDGSLLGAFGFDIVDGPGDAGDDLFGRGLGSSVSHCMLHVESERHTKLPETVLPCRRP